jgi:hypothetical protein
MKPDTFVQQAGRDPKIVQALHVARYMLVIHHGKTVRCCRTRLQPPVSRFQW